MLRILFDKNVPDLLRRHLIDYQVQTADEEGWGQISNEELISRAEKAGYQIMLTCDQNIQYQQNMSHRKISMVVLGSNIWPSIRPRIAEIAAALQRVSPGSFEFIEIARRRSGAGWEIPRPDGGCLAIQLASVPFSGSVLKVAPSPEYGDLSRFGL